MQCVGWQTACATAWPQDQHRRRGRRGQLSSGAGDLRAGGCLCCKTDAVLGVAAGAAGAPVPGSPSRRMPLEARAPRAEKRSGLRRYYAAGLCQAWQCFAPWGSQGRPCRALAWMHAAGAACTQECHSTAQGPRPSSAQERRRHPASAGLAPGRV